MRVDWKQLFGPEGRLREVLGLLREHYKRYGVGLSTRELFYTGVDLFWPGTKSAYNKVSSYVSTCCRQELIPWHLIRDGSNREITGLSSPPEDPDVGHDRNIYWLETYHRTYSIPRWYRQPRFVLLMLEKESDVAVLNALLRTYQVPIGFVKGFAGWQFIREAADTLIEQQEQGKEVIVLWFGDFDPTGKRLMRFALDSMRELGAEFEFTEEHELGITYDQYLALNLQDKPLSPSELGKFRRQQGYKEWVKRYRDAHPAVNGEIRAETAALRKHPDYFDSLFISAIERYFVPGIHEQALQLQECRREWLRYRLQQYQSQLGGEEEGGDDVDPGE